MNATRAPALARLGTYRVDRSYEWNYAHGPVWAAELPQVPPTPSKTYFGIEVASRLGIAAGLLLNANWIDFYGRWAATGDPRAPRHRRIDGQGDVSAITAAALAALKS